MAADMAADSGLQYPPNVHIVRVMCSGRVSPAFLLNALRLGADGVLVTGCRQGDCHYVSGNERTLQVVDKSKRLARILGIETDRIGVEWISSTEGARFAEAVTAFTDQIKEMGPNSLGALR